MKNSQKGFIIPVLLGIIAALAIGSGVYIYNIKKAEAPVVTNTEVQQSGQVQEQTTTQTQPETNQSLNVALDLSSSFARQYKTVLTEAFKKPANFNGHYVIAEIGCGTGCFTFVVVDKNTGKVYPAPIGNDIGQFMGNIGQPYDLSSNRIKIIADNGSKINTYAFTGSGFSLLSSVDSQSSASTPNWKTYTSTEESLSAISFKYPNDWKLNVGYYTTPAGYKYATGITITAPNGIDQISYGEGLQEQINCASLLANMELPGKIKCGTIKGMPFYLIYQDDSSLSIYNQILTTVK